MTTQSDGDTSRFRQSCDEAIARAAGDGQRVAELEIVREFFCNSAFRSALSDSVWDSLSAA